MKKLNIDKTWTLFLDRDGVLNHDTPGDYVRHKTMFRFFDTTLAAMKIFNQQFGKILIVTNQRGVGVGVMTLQDLNDIHEVMLAEINLHGGRIDKIYFSIETDKVNNTHRKPSTGMGLDAKNDFPEIDFAKAIMVGNNISDMQFGRKLGMITVYIDDRHERNGIPTEEMDYLFDNLWGLAAFISN